MGKSRKKVPVLSWGRSGMHWWKKNENRRYRTNLKRILRHGVKNEIDYDDLIILPFKRWTDNYGSVKDGYKGPELKPKESAVWFTIEDWKKLFRK